jgi:hypothetical protein
MGQRRPRDRRPATRTSPHAAAIPSHPADPRYQPPSNLGQEIRKGLDQKAAEGGWPARAPFGYRNVRRDAPGRRGESVLEPDHQAPLVVWAFERYATRSLSLASLTEALAEKGLRNRLGNPPGISAIHRMLRNPIYAGVVRWKRGARGNPPVTRLPRAVRQGPDGPGRTFLRRGAELEARSLPEGHACLRRVRLEDVLRGGQGPLRLLPLRRAEHQTHALFAGALRPRGGARARGRGSL